MRRVLAVAAAFCLIASGAMAAEGNGKQKVTYTVPAVVGFGAASFATAASGTPFDSTGLTLGAHFTPHANSQDVNMYVCATSLFKGDTPIAGGVANPNEIKIATSTETAPNAVLSGSGFTPTPQPMPLTLASTFAYDAYVWPRLCSSPVTFFGGSNNSFSNPVDVNVLWKTTNTELPTGGYSGYIQLYVATIP